MKRKAVQPNLLQFFNTQVQKQRCIYKETDEVLGFEWNVHEKLEETVVQSIDDYKDDTLDDELYEKIYCPKEEKDIFGWNKTQDPIYKNIVLFKTWKNEEWKKKPLLLCGASGSGKSMFIEVFMKEYSIWNESMLQEEETLIDSVKQLLERKPLFLKKRCIVIDCLEGIQNSEIIQFTNIFKKCKEYYVPIILTCDNEFDIKEIKNIKKECAFIKLNSCTKQTFQDIILNIVTKENLKVPTNMLELLYNNSMGNIRFALNELQFLLKTRKRQIKENNQSSLVPKDSEKNIWDTTQQLFSGVSIQTENLEKFDGDPIFSKIIFQNAFCITDFTYWEYLSQADVQEYKNSELSLYVLGLSTQVYGKKMGFNGPRKLQFPDMYKYEQKKMINENIKKTKGIEALPFYKWNLIN